MPLETSTLLNRRRIRRTFGKISEAVNMPNLIEVQRHSYDQYLHQQPPCSLIASSVSSVSSSLSSLSS